MSGLSEQNFEIGIKKFKRGKRINKESFVYNVQEKKTGEFYVAKVIDCGDEEEQCRKIVADEILTMFSVSHPTIIKYIGYSLKDFHDEYNVTIIMQLAKKGSLDAVLKMIQTSKPPKNYTNTTRQIILIGVARAMQYLHDHNIVHGNLSSENILLDEKYKPLLTNFVLSKSSTKQSKSQTQYMAPEIIKGASPDKKSDVYSFAILMFEIVTNSVPFESDEMTDFEFKSKVANDDFRPTFKCEVKRPIRNLIEKCWSKNSNKRSTFKELFQKLSNNNDGKDYFLDDVDEEEVKKYVNDIGESGESKIDEVMKINESLEKENDQLKTENEKLKTENKSFSKEINKLKSDNSLLKKKIDELTKELESLKKSKVVSSQKVSMKPNKPETSSKLPPLFQSTNTSKQEPNADQTATKSNLKKITIEEFNDSILQDQLETISRIASLKRYSKSNPIFINLNNLIQYMCQIIQAKDCKYIEILSRNEEKYLIDINEKSMIQIHATEAEDLFKSRSYKINKFANLLKPFKFFSFELVYPFKSFTDIYHIVVNLEEKLSNTNVDIIFRILEMDGFHDAALYCGQVNRVFLSDSINSISDDAFREFSSLTQIEIPSSVTKICGYAFCSCTSLTQIIIPSSVTEISEYSFKKCTSLTQLMIPSSVAEIGDGAFAECTSLTQVIIPSSVTIIGRYAFDECTSLIKIIIPSSVTIIGSYAFDECTSLSQIKLSSSLAEIDSGTFLNCSSLAEIEIPSSVNKIGESAFKGCTLLKQITIPSSVTKINDSVFANCTSLEKISIPSSIDNFHGDIFSECTNLKEISFYPDEEKKFNFYEKQFLLSKSSADNSNYDVLVWVNPISSKIIIPSFIKTIDAGAFEGYTLLKQIEIPFSVTSIKLCAFKGCSSLTQVKIPSSVTSIEHGAFEKCSSLKQIEIPSSITSIENGVFEGCSSLAQVKIPSSITEFNWNAFSRCTSLTQIEIPSSVKIIEMSVFQECSSLVQIKISSSVTIISKSLFEKCSSLKEIEIPPSVTKIDNEAFKECSSLTQITLPSSLNDLNGSIFTECYNLSNILINQTDEMRLNFFENKYLLLKSDSSKDYDVFVWLKHNIEKIAVPLSVKKIGDYAFNGCKWLTQIKLPSSLVEIGKCGFNCCFSLTQIDLPSSLIKIGDYAFNGCNSLKEIEIPSSVTEIGEYAFSTYTALKNYQTPSSLIETNDNDC